MLQYGERQPHSEISISHAVHVAVRSTDDDEVGFDHTSRCLSCCRCVVAVVSIGLVQCMGVTSRCFAARSRHCHSITDIQRLTQRVCGELSQKATTPCSKKLSPLMFDNNFGKCGPIFKIFHQVIRKKILCVRITQISTSPVCCYINL